MENMEVMKGFEIECVENIELMDAGDNAMNFINGFVAGISIVMIAT